MSENSGDKNRTVSFRIEPEIAEEVETYLDNLGFSTSEYGRLAWRALRKEPELTPDLLKTIEGEGYAGDFISSDLSEEDPKDSLGDYLLASSEIERYMEEGDFIGVYEVIATYEERHDRGTEKLKQQVNDRLE